MKKREINNTFKRQTGSAAIWQILFVAFFLFLGYGCNQSTYNKDVVARVNNQYLYRSALSGLVPNGTAAVDSLNITRNYINGWIRKQTILQQAKNNLPEELLNFDKQLEDYRNSLIVYTYEKELIKQMLDTIISDEEISEYYFNQQKNFELRENIVLADFVIIEKDSADKKLIKNYILSDSTNDHQKLEDYCKTMHAEYFLDEVEWIFFNDLIKYIPIKTYNQEQFLAQNKYVELADSLNLYFMRIRDFKIKESISPLDFEKDNIRMIILNKRKTQLLDNMERELFEQVLETNQIEIY